MNFKKITVTSDQPCSLYVSTICNPSNLSVLLFLDIGGASFIGYIFFKVKLLKSTTFSSSLLSDSTYFHYRVPSMCGCTDSLTNYCAKNSQIWGSAYL